jgi:hypothetical protein
MRLGDDLLDAIRQAGRLMVAQPERFTGHATLDCNQGGITRVTVTVVVPVNGATKM